MDGAERRDFDVLVVGAGLHGLAASWHLLRLGAGSVAILERFRVGHARGSSHGPSRIMRSSYPTPAYIELCRDAHAEDWPRLERDSGRKLIHPTSGCFFGPQDGPFESYAEAVRATGAPVERIDPSEAARRFPMLRFDGMAGALHDHTAGLIDAEGTLAALRELAVGRGATLFEDTAVQSLRTGGEAVEIETGRGMFRGGRAVVTAGPWTGSILPLLQPRLVPIRQTVAYLRLDASANAVRPGAFPCWGYLGPGKNGLVYGLPEFGCPGVKIGRHVTEAPADDPVAEGRPDARAVEELLGFASRHFVPSVEAVLSADTCFYTCTATEDYVIDLHPQDPRIAIGAGFSGHGFKLGPVTGRVLAELCLYGRTGVAAFERHRRLFALSR